MPEIGHAPIAFRPARAAPLRLPALPTLALLLVAVTWGVTFSVVDEATTTLPAADVVAWRFGLAGGILLLIRRSAPALPALLRRRAIALGGLLGAGFLLQTWAITYTDAVMSGFLVGTLVIIAPIAGWLLFGDRPGLAAIGAVTLAGAGLALLSLRGNGFGFGEASPWPRRPSGPCIWCCSPAGPGRSTRCSWPASRPARLRCWPC